MAIPRVRDVMREVIITVRDNEPLLNVLRIMYNRNIGSVVVMNEEGRAVGIFTERDLVRVVAKNGDVSSLTVGDVMTRDVIVVEADASLIKAVHIMAKHGIRHLPVVDSEGRVVGIISIRDAAIALARLLVDLNISSLGLTEEEASMVREITDVDVDEGRG
ncbi:MAG: CBS domain-containing protein [Vulcanisaeta sp.]|nr:CBS domain-containing protein [Vulcanisaeta sp.]MCG2892324.1 CBS domain-containing protein [Vulcanisaeta sp.]MCG2895129.1 CBS domain-containing protein [Vulcanisaeta sp.]